MTHGARGRRASEGPQPQPQPLGRCPCSAREAPASSITGAWPRGHRPSPREARVVPSLPTGASTPSQEPVGEGEGREDADKIKSMKWTVFSCAFLGGGFEATTANTWAWQDLGVVVCQGWWWLQHPQERVSSPPGLGPLRFGFELV